MYVCVENSNGSRFEEGRCVRVWGGKYGSTLHPSLLSLCTPLRGFFFFYFVVFVFLCAISR